MTDIDATLDSLLRRRLRAQPRAVAFVDGDRQLSYAEFDRECSGVAAWLAALGIGRGDRVAVWLVNRIEWIVMLFALSRIGATLVSVNTRFRATELEHVLARSAARLLVMQANFRNIEFEAVLSKVDEAGLPALKCVAVLDGESTMPARILSRPTVSLSLAAIQSASNAACPDQSSPDMLALLFTTSGTTKGPKLVMHEQRAIARHAQQVGLAFGFGAQGAATLGAVPFCGTFGLTVALASFSAGAPLIIMNAFDAPLASTLMRRHGLTHVFGTDEMLRRLLDANPQHSPFPEARLFGFVLNQELVIRAQKCGLPIVGMYGSSEVQALFSHQPFELPFAERVLAGGRTASPDAELRVRDVITGELLEIGASGELEIRASTNFLGYLDNPKANAKAIDSEGFFRTGDIGRLRHDRSFIFETRMGDAIRLGGFLVNPVEIEEVIRRAPGLTDAQVVAVEIEHQVRCVAFAIRQPGAAIRDVDVMEWVSERMANYKVPARVWFVERFPVTHSANGDKIQRAKLREMAQTRLAEST